jgi:hypothetical protein
MKTTKSRLEQRSDPLGVGPQIGFAGALTLVGLFAASTIDPDHLVRIGPRTP